MKKILFFLLFFCSKFSFAQIDSTNKLDSVFFSKYGHVALECGINTCIGNFDNLREKKYMLNKPSNISFLPIGAGMFLGVTNKYFCSIEGFFGESRSKGKYFYAGTNYDNLQVDIWHFKSSFCIYRNIYYSKQNMVDAIIGFTHAITHVKSLNTKPLGPGQGDIVFADGNIKQNCLYIGTMLRHIWSINEADQGFIFKIGYNIPIAYADYYLVDPTGQNPKHISLGGLTASCSIFLWTYNSS